MIWAMIAALFALASTPVPAWAAGTEADAIVYGDPIVIVKGGTYRGNWQSLDPDVPAVRVRTSEAVIIENSTIRSCAACIDVPSVARASTSGWQLSPIRGITKRAGTRRMRASSTTSTRRSSGFSTCSAAEALSPCGLGPAAKGTNALV